MVHDEEKQADHVAARAADTSSEDVSVEHGSHKHRSFLDRLLIFEAAMDRKLGIESQAIQRIRPEDKKPQSWHQQATMALLWAGATMNVSCLSTGFLGWELGLDLSQTIPITIFGTLLGSMVAGWCATMGPGTGLRQMSIARYSFGWYPSKILAALNVISQIGWSAVGCITAGSALSAVSDGKLSSIVGIVIIAVCSSVLNFCGLRAILEYQKYAWAIFFVLFMVMYGEMAPRSDVTTKSTLTGQDLSGAVLSLLAVVYGSSVSWATIASDFYVLHPINTSKLKVFTLTTLGIGLSTCVGMVLGCCVGSAMGAEQALADVYDEQGVGFLIQKMLYPRGFAKFVLVILVLAGIGMNCINLYSSALSVQQFARPLARIPRFVWTLVLFGVTFGIAAGGREHLNAYLQNFLSLLGYWATSFFVIVWCEHYIFRKGTVDNYDLEAWNDPKRLPLGLAALVSFLVGVVGWVLGMVETWFTGPVGELVGSAGGDLANELTFGFTLVLFVPLRFLELKYVGR
ncbi:Purine-cytosine permease fcyB [Cytospora mali]|uniref:Purine-cytosine permease fcyB n=1 Tax=Cytospora mali TaxID=578113 RepID=A0A194VAV7_CYTMA|nr:Purine-cytosine permease fcyB [Valsa mali var. pyri (nom. inval.)]